MTPPLATNVMSRERKTLRLDSGGRDVTNLPGLWDESDTHWVPQAALDGALGQLAEMRQTASGWAAATVELERICIPPTWEELRRMILAKFLAQPPSAQERLIAAALDLADEVDAWTRTDVPTYVLSDGVQDALAAYRAELAGEGK